MNFFIEPIIKNVIESNMLEMSEELKAMDENIYNIPTAHWLNWYKLCGVSYILHGGESIEKDYEDEISEVLESADSRTVTFVLNILRYKSCKEYIYLYNDNAKERGPENGLRVNANTIKNYRKAKVAIVIDPGLIGNYTTDFDSTEKCEKIHKLQKEYLISALKQFSNRSNISVYLDVSDSKLLGSKVDEVAAFVKELLKESNATIHGFSTINLLKVNTLTMKSLMLLLKKLEFMERSSLLIQVEMVLILLKNMMMTKF
ncbi:hypothetical protein BCR36DRAFT_372967 [Piromyces finnis]|uniref:Uncharacterized protein n=1 Tax=Piromyces finnis TaxID=1754191 RepID=A0A1Y1V172_9FUNG|nr:hypothetical protein BCR36DRAFT_372967 [Piromyces finnis]|eukprot:ORX45018.1 hypothetical protein BCR36DRAFT_372967 [Piromyces finnis]